MLWGLWGLGITCGGGSGGRCVISSLRISGGVEFHRSMMFAASSGVMNIWFSLEIYIQRKPCIKTDGIWGG